MKYGVDVASVRLDDLDKIILADVKERVLRGETVRVLDIGCGEGGLTVALLKAGAEVVAVDIGDYGEALVTKVAGAKLPPPWPLRFMVMDIRDFVLSNTETFEMVILQRVLHYLPYQDAVKLLTILSQCSKNIYLSVTGDTTAIARSYNAMDKPLTERWETLDKVGQDLFSITAPLCLYTKEELSDLLMQTGWQISWQRVSDFGNIKIVANCAGDGT